MGYFATEVLRGSKKFALIVLVIASWLVSFVDMFTGFAKGWWFITTAVLTAVGGFSILISKFSTDKKMKQRMNIAQQEALLFEPKREEEIRKILIDNPEFLTLCFECRQFDHNLRECTLKLEHEGHFPKVKEIKINNKTYCLYWEDRYH